MNERMEREFNLRTAVRQLEIAINSITTAHIATNKGYGDLLDMAHLALKRTMKESAENIGSMTDAENEAYYRILKEVEKAEKNLEERKE